MSASSGDTTAGKPATAATARADDFLATAPTDTCHPRILAVIYGLIADVERLEARVREMEVRNGT